MSARQSSRLLQITHYDDLTGLPNRQCFLEALRNSLNRTNRNPSRLFSVLFIDLDRFKVVNEGLSHVVGDRILKEVARRLRRCLRVVDVVARLGGDEFGVLLDEISDPMDVVYVVERVRKELLLTMSIVGYEMGTSASIGIAIGSTLYVQAEDVLRDSEIAMNRARKQGPGRYALFDAKMQEMAANRLSLEVDLRKAIEQDQLRIHYQPIVALETWRITGFEALVRWLHPNRGILLPAEFLPIAEDTDLIAPISRYVIRAACSQLSDWQARGFATGPLCVSVNLPSKVLIEPTLPGEILSLVNASGLQPSNLLVEITENQIIDNPETVSGTLKTLNSSGIRIAIDDFGKGYSSLSYLARLPTQILKIDQSFIASLGKCERNTAVVRAILSLGNCLGLEVIAEGVETADQLRQLRELQCTHAQGYYLGRPMEAKTVESLIHCDGGDPGAPTASGNWIC